MAEKTKLPETLPLAEAASNVREAQDALNDAAKVRGDAARALRAADLVLVQAKHSLALAERRVVLSALFENPSKPVPKTREEMSAFAKDWDAKVEEGRK